MTHPGSTRLILLSAAILSTVSGCGATPQDNGDPIEDGSVADSDDDTDGESPAPDCASSSISIRSAETSARIGTVGIVEWSTALTPVTSASIEFGLDTGYGHTAPADETAPHRTLLLGMKPSSVYHYRVVVNGCAGTDHTLETGPPPGDLPAKSAAVSDQGASAGGFIVTATGMKSHYAYILDADGHYVWWYPFTPEVDSGRMDGIARAKMSADGKSMWAGSINVGCGCGYLFRVSMDGLGPQETIPIDRHHDFTVLPDNTVTYIEYTDDGDRIVERDDSGETRTVYRLSDDFFGVGIDWSHCNAIHYYPEDDSYTVSCLNFDNILKIDRASGALIWNLAGDATGDFTGVSWRGQHGHQLLEGGLLMFSNSGVDRSPDTDEGSEAVELFLDAQSGIVSERWVYAGGVVSGVMGDVQRLPNGNTLVTYSAAGEIREIAPSGEIVRVLNVDGLGYTDWRPTLYGAPARH